MTDDPDRDPAIDALLRLDGQPGPARRLSKPATEALVASVLDAWQAPPTPPATNGGGRRSSATRVGLGLAAVVLVATGVFFLASRPKGPPPVTPPPAAPAIDSPATAHSPATATKPELGSRASDASRAQAPAPPLGPSPAGEPPPAVAPSDGASPEPAPRVDARRVAPVDLLEQANALRRSGRLADAEATYRRVVDAAPASREAHVARVAAGTIRLDALHDARGAARLFRGAMRGSSGALAAEAAFGLARASRALGDRTGEGEALRVIVDRHPGSPYASVASRRLAELEASSGPP